jgi:hypothetical protein
MKAAIKTIFAYLIIGPPAGFVGFVFAVPIFYGLDHLSDFVFGVSFEGYAMQSQNDKFISGSIRWSDLFSILPMGVLFSYLFGGVSAITVGCIASVSELKFHKTGWNVPVGAAVIISLCFAGYNYLQLIRYFFEPAYQPSLHAWQSFASINFGWSCAHIMAAWAGWKFSRSQVWQALVTSKT